ncbi:hypothetical protein B0H14DRAFT_2296964, partial [Mycena olivaceomarginata]
SVPLEILDNILDLAGTIPEEFVFNVASTYPVPRDSTARFCVLVCRDWYRAGKHLLYRTVFLDTKKQAEALSAAIQQDHRSGRYIKTLVLAHGLGRSMKDILLAAEHLETLSIWLNLEKGDSITGLLRGLPHINPRQLLI